MKPTPLLLCSALVAACVVACSSDEDQPSSSATGGSGGDAGGGAGGGGAGGGGAGGSGGSGGEPANVDSPLAINLGSVTYYSRQWTFVDQTKHGGGFGYAAS
ncbi:MAG: hypothetical protein JRI68_35020, partial [Deltaproteobacteria bacterium]|nr:hypothetical protein [Deltaproteobacteria bacterium]